MEKTLNDIVVATIQNYIPANENPVNTLIDVLNLSKESAYRRLRGQIPFTFKEVIDISKYLGFSLEEITERYNIKYKYTNDIQSDTQELDIINDCLFNKNISIYKNLHEAKKSNTFIVSTRIPIFFSMAFDQISTFNLYKMAHQLTDVPLNFYFSNFKLTQDTVNLQQQFTYYYNRIKSVTFLLDAGCFLNIINEIEYFCKRNLVSKEEKAQLKEELLLLLDSVENIAQKGRNEFGTKVDIYISSLNIEANYAYFQFDNNIISHFWTYGFNSLSINDNINAAKTYLKWFDSLKKYSTYITRCNENQCSEFVNNQRAIIESMSI